MQRKSFRHRYDIPYLLLGIVVDSSCGIPNPLLDLFLMPPKGQAKIAHLAAVGVDQPQHGFDRCRFPGPVSADEPDDLTSVQLGRTGRLG